MFFFFVCGEKTISSELPGYEGVAVQCHNCGNMSGHVLKRRPFFTFCFIPVIPFSISGFKDISCHICHFHEALERRPDVQAIANGGAPPPHQHAPPAHGVPQGWGGQQKPQQGHYQPQDQYQSHPPPQDQYQHQAPPPQYR